MYVLLDIKIRMNRFTCNVVPNDTWTILLLQSAHSKIGVDVKRPTKK